MHQKMNSIASSVLSVKIAKERLAPAHENRFSGHCCAKHFTISIVEVTVLVNKEMQSSSVTHRSKENSAVFALYLEWNICMW